MRKIAQGLVTDVSETLCKEVLEVRFGIFFYLILKVVIRMLDARQPRKNLSKNLLQMKVGGNGYVFLYLLLSLRYRMDVKCLGLTFC